MKRVALRCCGWFASATLALLGACSERRDAPVEPPPLVHPHAQAPEAAPPGAPDTRAMGAGAAPASCRVQMQELVARVNSARASGRRCGAHAMGPAGPLNWNDTLYSAAEGHSLDMAKRNYFEHRSPEGATVSQRVSAARYNWKSVGENLAAGDTSVAEAVQGWLDSPEHCENMLDARFRDVAVACVQQPGTQWGTYWTMVLGRKQ